MIIILSHSTKPNVIALALCSDRTALHKYYARETKPNE